MFSKKRAGTALALATGAALILAGCAGGSSEHPRRHADVRPGREGHARPRVLGQRRARRPLQPGHRGVQRGVPEHHGEHERSSPSRSSGRSARPRRRWRPARRHAVRLLVPASVLARTTCCSTSDPYLGNIIETEPLAAEHPRHRRRERHDLRHPDLHERVGPVHEPGAARAGRASRSSPAAAGRTTPTGWARSPTASGGAFYGGTDYTGRIQNFELQLRSEGSYLFSEDGKPGFDEARLTEFWESGADARDGIVRSAAASRGGRAARAASTPRVTASELTWDNFGAGYLGEPRCGLHRARAGRSSGHEGRREGPVPEALDAARDLGEDRAPRGRGDAGRTS